MNCCRVFREVEFRRLTISMLWPKLKLQGQVQLHELILVDGVDLRDVLVAAAGTQLFVGARGLTVTDGSNQIVGESISEGRVESLQVGGAFKKIRVKQIGVQRVLLNVLPIDARLPGASLGHRAINLAHGTLAADGQAKLIGFVLISLQGDVQRGEMDVRVGGGRDGGLGAGGAIHVFRKIAKNPGLLLKQPEIHFKGKFLDQQVVDAGLIVIKAVGG